jgi:cytochrome c peroxidase
MRWAAALALVALAGCPRASERAKPATPAPRGSDATATPTATPDALAVVLPPAPPLPAVPAGLPALPDTPVTSRPTPEAVALGQLLFYDARLARSGKTSCATCHDPAHDFAGAGRQPTATGEPNLRRAPPLVNLAWRTSFGCDGRYATLDDQLAAHVKGQLGDDLATSVLRIAPLPLYAAHFARLAALDPRPAPALAETALASYVITRYAGGAPWDKVERAPARPAELEAGYKLFTGKAQCSVCHTPPLYTDLGFHRIGLVASPDPGRGLVDPKQAGAFATPTLRGAAAEPGFFHDGSAPTLDAAIDWHLAGGTGQRAARSLVDPALEKIALSPTERAQLGAFVRALTAAAPPPVPPALP